MRGTGVAMGEGSLRNIYSIILFTIEERVIFPKFQITSIEFFFKITVLHLNKVYYFEIV